MENDKKVTICIPTYNASETIGETLESLVNQTYKNIKVKVFDNQSTDQTIEIVRSFKHRFKDFELNVNEKNLGGEGNFTRCLLAAEGEFSGVFHSDDIYEPNMIEEQVKCFLSNKEVVAVSTHASEINEIGVKTGERFLPDEIESEITLFDYKGLLKLSFKYGNVITCPSVLAKSEIWKERIKCWNGKEFNTSADLDVWLRISKHGKFAFIKKPLINYRVSQASYSFRIAKKRITSHDLFLVLNSYCSDPCLDKEDFDHKRFLSMKDDSYRALNIIRTRNSKEPFPVINYDWRIILSSIFLSKWHRKMSFAIMGIWIMKLLFPLPLRKVIGKSLEG